MAAGLDLGFYSSKKGCGTSDILKATKEGKVKTLHPLAADNINVNEIGKDCFVIY